jgi:hypothetical protein
LLEVVLAVTLTVSLIGAVLWFYDSAVSTRAVVVREAEIAAAERMIMDRITDDLRGAMASRFLGVGMEGQTDEVEFLTARLPGPGAWVKQDPTDDPIPPEYDLQLIGYRLRMQEDEDGELQVVGLERAVQKIPGARAVEVEEDIPTLLLSEHIRFLRLRYWDGSTWLDSWSGGDVPQAVEIIMGSEPLPEGIEPDEYPYSTFRRSVYISGGGRPQRTRTGIGVRGGIGGGR